MLGNLHASRGYADVNAAVDRPRIRIGAHRTRVNVGDGARGASETTASSGATFRSATAVHRLWTFTPSIAAPESRVAGEL